MQTKSEGGRPAPRVSSARGAASRVHTGPRGRKDCMARSTCSKQRRARARKENGERPAWGSGGCQLIAHSTQPPPGRPCHSGSSTSLRLQRAPRLLKGQQLRGKAGVGADPGPGLQAGAAGMAALGGGGGASDGAPAPPPLHVPPAATGALPAAAAAHVPPAASQLASATCRRARLSGIRWLHIRYPITTVAERDTPARQWTSTPPAGSGQCGAGGVNSVRTPGSGASPPAPPPVQARGRLGAARPASPARRPSSMNANMRGKCARRSVRTESSTGTWR